MVDSSVIVCDKLINVTNSVSANVRTNIINTVTINITSTAAINADDKEKNIKQIFIFCTRFY